MIISDLEHLELVAKETPVVNGGVWFTQAWGDAFAFATGEDSVTFTELGVFTLSVSFSS
ncbi:hypothetical protein [Coleofasciculus sp. G2-EDA-02]|uniref:hypothetical protein n=1 Tax=Coleofasciculus sp. G2-EDA-02 TaxID=3069529 RepID=UPI0032F33788